MVRNAHIPLLSLLLVTPGCFSGGPSLPEFAIIGAVLLLFFGADKLPKLMRGMGSGITEFKKGLKDGDKSKSEGDASTPPADSAPETSSEDE